MKTIKKQNGKGLGEDIQKLLIPAGLLLTRDAMRHLSGKKNRGDKKKNFTKKRMMRTVGGSWWKTSGSNIMYDIGHLLLIPGVFTAGSHLLNMYHHSKNEEQNGEKHEEKNEEKNEEQHEEQHEEKNEEQHEEKNEEQNEEKGEGKLGGNSKKKLTKKKKLNKKK